MPDTEEQLGLTGQSSAAPVTEARIVREIANLKENLNGRLAEMQRAVDLTQKFPTLLDQVKADLKEQFSAADKALFDRSTEKHVAVNLRFDGIQAQFVALDRLIDQAQTASKEAVDRAFKAAGDASKLQADQSEKSINNLTALFNQANGSTGEKIATLDRRLTIIEGRKEGGAATIGYIFAAIGAFVGVIGIIAAVVAFADRGAAPQIIYQSPPPAVGQSSIITPIVPQK